MWLLAVVEVVVVKVTVAIVARRSSRLIGEISHQGGGGCGGRSRRSLLLLLKLVLLVVLMVLMVLIMVLLLLVLGTMIRELEHRVEAQVVAARRRRLLLVVLRRRPQLVGLVWQVAAVLFDQVQVKVQRVVGFGGAFDGVLVENRLDKLDCADHNAGLCLDGANALA